MLPVTLFFVITHFNQSQLYLSTLHELSIILYLNKADDIENRIRSTVDEVQICFPSLRTLTLNKYKQSCNTDMRCGLCDIKVDIS